MNIIIENTKITEIFNSSFELIDSGYNTGEFNMNFDFERVKLCSEGKALPMFRLYGWKPWAVSLGANQKDNEIDYELCKKMGFDVVRRPTGGRAVLHANELTYSVVLNLYKSITIHDLYREIHNILLNSFAILGINELEFGKSQPDFREFYKKQDLSISCFASTARYEIESQGKKVVGSAQRLFGNTLLQHGSILISNGHELLADVANTSDDEARIKLKEYILNHAITLSDVAKRNIEFDELKNSVISYLEK